MLSSTHHKQTSHDVIEERGDESFCPFKHAQVPSSSQTHTDVSSEDKTTAQQRVKTEIIQEFSSQSEDIAQDEDLKATLICKLDELTGKWEMRLTHIKGHQVVYLLGKKFNLSDTLDLELLIPADKREEHHAFVTSILNEGPSSEYWPFLFGGKMFRTIKIMNPHNQTPRLVKIKMNVNPASLVAGNYYVFDMTLTDQTAMNAVATKAGLVTHDLRGYIRTVIHTLSESTGGFSRDAFMNLSPQELGQLYDLQKEKDKQAIEVLHEGLKLCKDTREDFLPESVIKQSLIEQVDHSVSDDEDFVEEHVQAFIQKTQLITNECELSFVDGHTESKLDSKKIDILEQFLLNLIRNAIQAGAHKIDIKSSCESDQLTLEVTDNGIGMPESLLSTFFVRPMPELTLNHSPRSIESKRGEGALMANERWELIGGKSVAMHRQDGQPGTTFQLSIPAPHHQFFMKKMCSLTEEQRISLTDLRSMDRLKGIILLVDDSFVTMKMLLKNVTNILFSISPQQSEIASDNLKSVKIDDWQQKKFVIETRGDWGIVCAANGRVAYDIVMAIEILATITDQEMPMMNGLELIASIRKLERIESRPRMRIALNTALAVAELTPILSTEIDLIIRKGEKTDMSPFFTGITRPSPTLESEYRL